jgi:protein subunit release factor A
MVKERVEKARALNDERQRQQASGRVRTYNFYRNEVTDHRTGRKTRDVIGVMDGKLDLVR